MTKGTRKVYRILSEEYYKRRQIVENIDLEKYTVSGWFQFADSSGLEGQWQRLFDQDCIDALNGVNPTDAPPTSIMIETRTKSSRFSESSIEVFRKCFSKEVVK